MRYPRAIQNLIDHFTKFPTVGPKTAERYVFHLLKQHPEDLQQLAQAIAELKEKTIICKSCFAVADANPCSICTDAKRDGTIICVVSNTRDMIAIEHIHEYKGKYHIIGGVLDPLEGIKPENLLIKPLLERIKKNKVNEIILAMNSNLEGETTALYLHKVLTPFKLKVSRLAKGLPTGADLEYADEMTLVNALKYRVHYK